VRLGRRTAQCVGAELIRPVISRTDSEIVIWYIHGWKHNASSTDPDFENFKKLIDELVNRQGQLDAALRRHVVGIYIGWDGAVGPKLLQNLSFWDRKRAADRISQSAVLTKIFSAAKYARRQAGEVAARDLTVMIGHSFGARILYTATSQVLVNEVQRQHPGKIGSSYGLMTGPADLVMLLNPAFEASVFTAMHSIRRPDTKARESIDKRQQPLLLALSAENDWATGTAFPIGQWLDGARRERQRITLGNYDEYVTHRLQAVGTDLHSLASSDFWYDCFEAAGLMLFRTATTQPGNPFLIARTTRDIIDGHNGILGDKLRSWTVNFLLEIEKRRTAPQLHGPARCIRD
jgi:hypothetical protein